MNMQSFAFLRVLALAVTLFAFSASAAPASTKERTTSFIIIGDSTSKYECVSSTSHLHYIHFEF